MRRLSFEDVASSLDSELVLNILEPVTAGGVMDNGVACCKLNGRSGGLILVCLGWRRGRVCQEDVRSLVVSAREGGLVERRRRILWSIVSPLPSFPGLLNDWTCLRVDCSHEWVSHHGVAPHLRRLRLRVRLLCQ